MLWLSLFRCDFFWIGYSCIFVVFTCIHIMMVMVFLLFVCFGVLHDILVFLFQNLTFYSI